MTNGPWTVLSVTGVNQTASYQFPINLPDCRKHPTLFPCLAIATLLLEVKMAGRQQDEQMTPAMMQARYQTSAGHRFATGDLIGGLEAPKASFFELKVHGFPTTLESIRVIAICFGVH